MARCATAGDRWQSGALGSPVVAAGGAIAWLSHRPDRPSRVGRVGGAPRPVPLGPWRGAAWDAEEGCWLLHDGEAVFECTLEARLTRVAGGWGPVGAVAVGPRGERAVGLGSGEVRSL